MGLEFFRTLYYVFSKKDASWEVAPAPKYNAGIFGFVACLSVLYGLTQLVLPDAFHAWLIGLAGPHKPRDPWQTLLFLGPMVLFYFPVYYYFFLSQAGQAAQREFERFAAPVIDKDFSSWRWSIKGIVIALVVPAMFVAGNPLSISLISILALCLVTLQLRGILRRASV